MKHSKTYAGIAASKKSKLLFTAPLVAASGILTCGPTAFAQNAPLKSPSLRGTGGLRSARRNLENVLSAQPSATEAPSASPSAFPSAFPTVQESEPSAFPSSNPTYLDQEPSENPTSAPSSSPSGSPTNHEQELSHQPSSIDIPDAESNSDAISLSAEGDGDIINDIVVTSNDYPELIEEAATEADRLGELYEKVVDVDSAVEILGIDRKFAESVNIKYEAKHISDLFKGVASAARECKNGCANSEKAIKAISTLLTTAGGFVAVANPALGIMISTLGGTGMLIGALFGDDSSSGLTIGQVHKAVTDALKEVHYDKYMHELQSVQARAASRTKLNGKTDAIIYRNSHNQTVVDNVVERWAKSWNSEWGFWLERYTDLEKNYNEIYGPASGQGNSYRSELVTKHLNQDCHGKCSVRGTNSNGSEGTFDRMKMKKFLEETSGECGKMLEAGEDAFQKMSAFAVAYLEVSSHLIEFGSTSIDIMQKQSFCDPRKYSEKDIEVKCDRYEDILRLTDEIRRNIKFFFSLSHTMREEIPTFCHTESVATWPFGGKSGPQFCSEWQDEPEQQLCSYPNLFSIEKVTWDLSISKVDSSNKMTEMTHRMRPIGNKLKNDCDRFYNDKDNRELDAKKLPTTTSTSTGCALTALWPCPTTASIRMIAAQSFLPTTENGDMKDLVTVERVEAVMLATGTVQTNHSAALRMAFVALPGTIVVPVVAAAEEMAFVVTEHSAAPAMVFAVRRLSTVLTPLWML
ncbi:MAG: hypothetical protein SGARI_000099 [Bacillariaceae sp.]